MKKLLDRESFELIENNRKVGNEAYYDFLFGVVSEQLDKRLLDSSSLMALKNMLWKRNLNGSSTASDDIEMEIENLLNNPYKESLNNYSPMNTYPYGKYCEEYFPTLSALIREGETKLSYLKGYLKSYADNRSASGECSAIFLYTNYWNKELSGLIEDVLSDYYFSGKLNVLIFLFNEDGLSRIPFYMECAWKNQDATITDIDESRFIKKLFNEKIKFIIRKNSSFSYNTAFPWENQDVTYVIRITSRENAVIYGKATNDEFFIEPIRLDRFFKKLYALKDDLKRFAPVRALDASSCCIQNLFGKTYESSIVPDDSVCNKLFGAFFDLIHGVRSRIMPNYSTGYVDRIHKMIPQRDKLYCRMADEIIHYDSELCKNCPLNCGSEDSPACKYRDYETADGISAKEYRHRIRVMHNDFFLEKTKFPDFEFDNNSAVYIKALKFAAVAHNGAVRKGTKIPYIVHPVEVSMIVYRMFKEKKQELTVDDFNVVAAAALHDVVEDTDYGRDDIERKFGSYISSLVAEESENKREHLPAADTWKIRKEEFLYNLKNAPIEAKMITLGDKLSNLRASAKDYREIGDALFEKFNQKDKKEHEWYYRSVAEELKCFEGYSAYKEYIDLCDEIFS